MREKVKLNSSKSNKKSSKKNKKRVKRLASWRTVAETDQLSVNGRINRNTTRFRVRVQARNSAGNSGWTSSRWVRP